MKRALALVAVALMAMICIVPVLDVSDADPADTTVSAKFYCDRDLSTATASISVIYYDSTSGEDGEIVGTTTTIQGKDEHGYNKFTVKITPNADLTKNNYYFLVNVEGYSVMATTSALSDEPVDVKVKEGTSTVIKKCYQITASGDLTPNADNDINGTFVMTRVSLGNVTGFVMIDTKEPIYLNNVIVTLYDLSNNESLVTTKTDKGSYNIEYNAGDYGLRFELGGYNTQTSDIRINENTTTTLNVHMTQDESYFGLDLPHVLMVLGGAAALVLLLFTMFMRLRLSRK